MENRLEEMVTKLEDQSKQNEVKLND